MEKLVYSTFIIMRFKTCYSLLPAVLLLYCIPLIAFGLYIAKYSSTVSWKAFSGATFLLALGSLALFIFMRYWEVEWVKRIYSPGNLKEPEGAFMAKEEMETLRRTQADAEWRIQQKEAECLKMSQCYEELQLDLQAERQLTQTTQKENEQLQAQLSTLKNDLRLFKESTEEKLEQNQIFLHEHQQTITEQRQVIETKQQHINQLEDKVRDLTYEIKTLLHIAEKTQINEQQSFTVKREPFSKPTLIEGALIPPHADQPLDRESEASLQLKRCLDIAQKMTGANHYQRQLKKSELSMEHYALDLRCLFESLRNENSCAMIVYSQKENKLIFGNPQIKTLLGWGSEKFIQNFSNIIEESLETWNHCLTQLAYKNECQAELSLKSKGGAVVPVKCHLGVIPTGIFRSNILGVFF